MGGRNHGSNCTNTNASNVATRADKTAKVDITLVVSIAVYNEYQTLLVI